MRQLGLDDGKLGPQVALGEVTDVPMMELFPSEVAFERVGDYAAASHVHTARLISATTPRCAKISQNRRGCGPKYTMHCPWIGGLSTLVRSDLQNGTRPDGKHKADASRVRA